MIKQFALGVALTLTAASAAAQAPAQQAPEPGPMELQPATDVIAALPPALAGAFALKMPNSPITMYMPKRLGKDPMALVMATRNSEPAESGNLAEQVRGSFHESGLRKIVREGTFSTPKWPNATTFFGEYVAGSGRKQNWTLIDGDVRVSVMVTFFNAKDAARLQAEVADKVFGGAVVSAGAKD